MIDKEIKDSFLEEMTPIPDKFTPRDIDSLFNNVWGNSVLSNYHDIPVDNFGDTTQTTADEPRMKEIKADASLEHIKLYMNTYNLGAFTETLKKLK